METSLYIFSNRPKTQKDLINRRQEFDHFNEISPLDKTLLSNFEISNVSPLPLDEQKDTENDSALSFFIDGEAYSPCKISGKLLIEHIDIIRHWDRYTPYYKQVHNKKFV